MSDSGMGACGRCRGACGVNRLPPPHNPRVMGVCSTCTTAILGLTCPTNQTWTPTSKPHGALRPQRAASVPGPGSRGQGKPAVNRRFPGSDQDAPDTGIAGVQNKYGDQHIVGERICPLSARSGQTPPGKALRFITFLWVTVASGHRAMPTTRANSSPDPAYSWRARLLFTRLLCFMLGR